MITGLTKSQVENLVDFIELNFIDFVREDEELDNIDYIIDMMDALTKLRATLDALKLEGKGKPKC